jgi:Questin oxidase-like
MQAASYESLDDALAVLAGHGIALANGNSNHGPMVAEALCAMGRPEAVMPWIARYRDRMLPRVPAGDPISRAEWRVALGRRDRFTDWANFFDDELEEASWPLVLDRWVGRLAPGFCAAATHGVIRVGHAARSLTVGETAPRRRELADALGSWAATYQELPGSAAIAEPGLPPSEAIAQVPVIPLPRRRKLGNITASLAMLDDFPEFASVHGIIAVDDDIKPLLSELTEVFARVYLANAHDSLTAIVFIHCVTSLAALGNIMLAVRAETAHAMLRYAWQSACALYACFGSGRAMADEIARCEDDWDRLVERAVANGDEHVVKFTEACLQRDPLGPSPAYAAAVTSALTLLQRR